MRFDDFEGPLSLAESATRLGIPFAREVAPRDGEIASDIPLHYLDWGDDTRQPVILLHGRAQQAHTWDFVSLSLCDRYRVIAVDARGHGDSGWSQNADYGWEAHQRDIDAVVDQLCLANPILIGHSMGGRSSLVYASRSEADLKALVIVDIGPETNPQGRRRIQNFVTRADTLGSLEEFAERIHSYTGRPYWSVYSSLKYSVKQLSDGQWTWKYDKIFRDPNFVPKNLPANLMWDQLAHIRCPALLIKGAESDTFSEETMHKMLSVIPNSTGAIVSKAGHLVSGDNPIEFLEVLNRFLDTVD